MVASLCKAAISFEDNQQSSRNNDVKKSRSFHLLPMHVVAICVRLYIYAIKAFASFNKKLDQRVMASGGEINFCLELEPKFISVCL